jgi:AbrB family looped-hinge helix DNA binding protein
VRLVAETEITVVSANGQVVIPQDIREKLGLRPKTKLIVYGEGDTIIMKKIHLPDLKEEWERIAHMIEERNEKYGLLTEEDVKKELEDRRQEEAKA